MTKRLTPAEMLRSTEALLTGMEEAKNKAVFVGLPKEKAGGQIYGDGRSILDNAAVHEYGTVDGKIPERSFLRVPFQIKRDEIGAMLVQQFTAIAEGRRSVNDALGRVGIAAVNIVKEAFRTGGFGKWKKLKPATIEAKGFDDILEDTRVMRNSVTWVVRDDTRGGI